MLNRELPFRDFVSEKDSVGLYAREGEQFFERSKEKSSQLELRDIPHLQLPSVEILVQDFEVASQPAVFANGMDGWSSSRWTLEAIEAELGDLSGRAYVDTNKFRASVTGDPTPFVELSIRDYIAVLQGELELEIDGESSTSLRPYMAHRRLPERMHAFLKMPPSRPAGALKVDMWLGPGGTVTPLHADLPDGYLVQILGAKQITLFPPHHDSLLGAVRSGPRVLRCPVDVDNPDLELFPSFSSARSFQLLLQEGEMLFLPGGWFHHVRSVGDVSLSVKFWAVGQPPFAAWSPE